MWFFTSLVCVLLQGAVSSNILGIFPMYLPSHHMAFDALMVGLAERGHNVTVYSVYPKDHPLPNYYDISLTDCFKNDKSRYLPKLENIIVCEPLLRLRKMQGNFDLLITETFRCDFFALFGPALGVPVILTCSGIAQPWMCAFSGMPCNPTYVPVPTKTNPFKDFSRHNFLSRLGNTWNYITMNTHYYYKRCERQYHLVLDFFPQDTPGIAETVRNASMWFFNTHYTLNRARPLVPNVIEIGGISIRSPKELPEDIRNFINESINGVAIVSLNFFERSSDAFLESERSVLLSALAELQVRTIVRWEANYALPGQTDNIMTVKRLPQRDILAHPKVKLLICHGSLISIQEAVHEGVPVLGIPITTEQRLNVRNLEENGAGVLLKRKKLTKDILSIGFSESPSVNKGYVVAEIAKLIYDEQYKKNAMKLSSSFNDRPSSPLDTAIFWTEYVIRHRGAAWLKTDVVHLSWWEYSSVDQVLFVLLVFTTVFMHFRRFSEPIMVGPRRLPGRRLGTGQNWRH